MVVPFERIVLDHSYKKGRASGATGVGNTTFGALLRGGEGSKVPGLIAQPPTPDTQNFIHVIFHFSVTSLS